MSFQQSRTQWAEMQVEALLSVPFIAEFVLRSPQKNDGTQKEVADLLILHKDNSILVSQKAQKDPVGRSEEVNERWVLKAAKKGVSQLCGALRPSTRAIWCMHPRRGRIDFPTGLPPIVHGIVTVETLRPVELQADAAELPLIHGSTPITYISLSDFMNIALQLRTVPELIRYLDARRELPEAALRKIGDEQTIFEFYLLRGTFKECRGHEHAREVVEAASTRMDEILGRMVEYRHFSGLIEQVGHELAIRSDTCLDGLTQELLTHFDPTEHRSNYRLMQEVIADLPLRERSELGKQFDRVIQRLSELPGGYVQAAAHVDSRPEWVFVFGASRGWERAGLLGTLERIMRAALSYYGKQQCMIIIARDGEGYEVAMKRPEQVFTPTPEDQVNGNKLFGNLRMIAVELSGF